MPFPAFFFILCYSFFPSGLLGNPIFSSFKSPLQIFFFPEISEYPGSKMNSPEQDSVTTEIEDSFQNLDGWVKSIHRAGDRGKFELISNQISSSTKSIFCRIQQQNSFKVSAWGLKRYPLPVNLNPNLSRITIDFSIVLSGGDGWNSQSSVEFRFLKRGKPLGGPIFGIEKIEAGAKKASESGIYPLPNPFKGKISFFMNLIPLDAAPDEFLLKIHSKIDGSPGMSEILINHLKIEVVPWIKILSPQNLSHHPWDTPIYFKGWISPGMEKIYWINPTCGGIFNFQSMPFYESKIFPGTHTISLSVENTFRETIKENAVIFIEKPPGN